MIALEGLALAPGRAAGAALVVRRAIVPRCRTAHGSADRDAIFAARRAAESGLQRRLDALPDGPARQILRAHLALLSDPLLLAAIEQRLDGGLGAEAAVEDARSALATRFEALADPALRARADDLRDVCDALARHLSGSEAVSPAAHGRVVCATELTPAEVLHLADGSPLAFVLESGAVTSHAVILIRALGVPAVISVAGAATLARDGDLVLVDGTEGRVIVDPDSDVASGFDLARTPLSPDADPARTRDGLAVAVTATIAGVPDARRAMAAGADGIGLFRTEWLFLNGDRLPTEEEQTAIYSEVAAIVGDRPVTVRAIDLGGDKRPAALRLPAEPNPALGLRGIRLALAYPDVLRTQVRALSRAFAGRRFRLLLPMVNDAGDISRVRECLDRPAGSGAGPAFEIGAMIETPAAVLMADEIAAAADFLSLGTNDLTQYVLAVDRDNASVSALYQPLHPAVLRLVRLAAEAARRHGRPLSVCGEIAGDPRVAPLLTGFGATELSVAPAAVATIKRALRDESAGAARALGEELTALPTADAVAARLARMDGTGPALRRSET